MDNTMGGLDFPHDATYDTYDADSGSSSSNSHQSLTIPITAPVYTSASRSNDSSSNDGNSNGISSNTNSHAGFCTARAVVMTQNQRRLMERKSHTKSRLGCFNCKRRRIKVGDPYMNYTRCQCYRCGAFVNSVV